MFYTNCYHFLYIREMYSLLNKEHKHNFNNYFKLYCREVEGIYFMKDFRAYFGCYDFILSREENLIKLVRD